MAVKKDFTEQEWKALHKGVTGAGMLVSLSDRDLSDSFGEVGAMTKFLSGQQVSASSELVRELSKERSSGFGLFASPGRVRNETMESLNSAVSTLTAKAPSEVEAYQQLVLGVAAVVAEAKGGETPTETAMIAAIRDAIGAAAGT